MSNAVSASSINIGELIQPDRIHGRLYHDAGLFRREMDEIFHKVDYNNPLVLRSFVTDRGKMIPRRISGASARQQRTISTAIRRARMLALLPFSVTGD